jgi:hypothetical protein
MMGYIETVTITHHAVRAAYSYVLHSFFLLSALECSSRPNGHWFADVHFAMHSAILKHGEGS